MKPIYLALVAAISGCGQDPPPSPEKDSRFKTAASFVFKDPASLQFQDTSNNDQVFCGQVNAKNAFGAYVGFRLFVFDKKANQLWVEDTDETEGKGFQNLLDAMEKCTNSFALSSIATQHVTAKIRAFSDAANATTE
jgi:hypothetical protein